MHATQSLLLLFLLIACSLVAAPEIALEAQPDQQWELIEADATPLAVAPRLPAAPEIDGQAAENAWSAAASIGTMQQLVNLPPAAADWLELRLGFTAEALYVTATLQNPSDTLSATVEEDFGRIWRDDALELFLHDVQRDLTYQIDVNALGYYWAGAHAPGVNWQPELRVAATRQPTSWTVELEIPWERFGEGDPEQFSFDFQARYLVKGQSGWAAWLDADAARDYGNLVLTEQADYTGDFVRVRRLLFPRELPSGQNLLGLEVENPTDQPRKVSARVYIDEPREVESGEYVTVPAGQTQQILLPIEMPASDTISRLIGFRDMVTRRLQFMELRRIAVAPPLSCELYRERFWYGDRSLEGELQIALPDDVRQQSRLRLELWNRKAIVAERELSTLSARRYRLSVPLQELSPGTYRLAAILEGPDSTYEELMEVDILRPQPLPVRQRINLQVDWPEGNNLTGSAPVYAGVAFPGGMLLDPEQLQVIDGDGQAVPTQHEVLATWSPGGSIRWLGLYFSAVQGRRYQVEFGREVKRQTRRGITLKETAHSYLIDTDKVRLEVPFSGPLLGPAWIGDRQILAGESPCLLIRDQRGRVANELGGTADSTVVVEVAGPERVVIRRDGRYRTAGGEALAGYTVRLTFAADSADIGIQHSLIMTEATDKLQFSDVAVRVQPALAAPWQIQLDSSPAYNGETKAYRINPADGERAYLAQLVRPHHFFTESEYVAGTGPENESRGETAGQWGSMRTTAGGLAWTIRNLTNTFPKELSFGPEGAIAHLWSSRGGRLLDYRASTLVPYFGEEWFADWKGGLEAALALTTNAQGTARTHDLTLHLLAQDLPNEELVARAHLADQPILVMQDPAWLNKTDALGGLHPYDPERFPKLEAYHEAYFREYIAGQAERVGDVGYFVYGAGPHTYTTEYPGAPDHQRKYPRFYRYSAVDYHGRTANWLAYARTGKRLYGDYASAFTRNFYDYRFSYVDLPSRPLGARLSGGFSHDGPFFWTGVPSAFGVQGADLDHFYLAWYLTGDRRASDGPRLWQQWMRRTFAPLILPKTGGLTQQPYWMLAQAYRADWDEAIGGLLRDTRERLLDSRTTTGMIDSDYYGAHYKLGSALYGSLYDTIATGSQAATTAFLKGAAYYRDSMMPTYGAGYQDHSGIYMNYAWRLSGDSRFASWMDARLGRHTFRYVDDDLELLPNSGYSRLYAGPWNSNIFETLAYGMDLVTRAADQIQPWPYSETGDTFGFAKQPHEPVNFYLDFAPDFELTLMKTLDNKDANRRDYFVGPVHTDFQRLYFSQEAPGLASGFGQLTIPVETLAGDYRLQQTKLLTSDARQLVSVIPDGAFLNAVSDRPRSWFFQLPAKSEGAIALSRDTELIRDGESRVLTGGIFHPLQGGSEDAMLELRPRGRTWLQITGDIPPIVAEHDATRWYLPSWAPAATPPGPLADPEEEFVSGISGEGLLLNGSRQLRLPGAAPDHQYEHLDPTSGTLEFWLRPQWSSRLLAEAQRLDLLQPSSVRLQFYTFVEEGLRLHEFSGFQLSSVRQGEQRGFFRLHHPAPLRQGRWMHLAYCWEMHPEMGFISQLFVNGSPGLPRRSGDNTLSRFAWREGDGDPADWQWTGFSRPITFLGEINAVIDEIRLSNEPRYRQAFTPDSGKPFPMDEQTLLLMHLDGDLEAQLPDGTTATATFTP